MDIHELFEMFYEKNQDLYPGALAKKRMINGSYDDLRTANAFRNFKAGYEAALGNPIIILADCQP